MLSDASRFGPLHGASMFAFERNIKNIKSLFHGTRYIGKQVAEKSFLRKACLTIAEDAGPMKSSLETNISDSTEIKIIDSNRCLVRGLMYHSINYVRKQNSCSYICKFFDFDRETCYGEIQKFVNEPSGIMVEIKMFRLIDNLCHLIETSNSTYHSVDDFVVVSSESCRQVTVPVNHLLRVCIRIVLKINGVSRNILTPIMHFNDYF